MDPNVPHAHLVRTTTGSLEDVMPPAPNLELHTKSLDEAREFVVDQAIPLVKQSVAHLVPMKSELLENAVNPDPPSTHTTTVSNHPTFHELSSETVLPRSNSRSHLPTLD